LAPTRRRTHKPTKSAGNCECCRHWFARNADANDPRMKGKNESAPTYCTDLLPLASLGRPESDLCCSVALDLVTFVLRRAANPAGPRSNEGGTGEGGERRGARRGQKSVEIPYIHAFPFFSLDCGFSILFKVRFSANLSLVSFGSFTRTRGFYKHRIIQVSKLCYPRRSRRWRRPLTTGRR